MSPVSTLDLVEPSFHWVPEYHATDGPAVADLAEMTGLVLDPEQRMALDAMFAVDRSGRPVALEVAVVCARQNMKTALFEAAVLGDLFILDDRLVIWTAHLFDTAQEAFRNLDDRIGGTPTLSRRVLRINRANGDEGFELRNGSRLKFKARSKTGGRGLTGDKVILDEAFALGPSEMGALLPTMSARPNPQVRYGSSAGLDSSASLRAIRDRGRKGGDPSLAYLEWCAPQDSCAEPKCDHGLDKVGCALDDPEMWRRANPAMDRRISREHIAAERRALSLEPEEFARERLGWWSDPGVAEMPYPLKSWDELNEGPYTGTVAAAVVGIDTNPIRSRSALVVCGDRDDGLDWLEVAAYESGTSWVVEACAGLVESIDPRFVMAESSAAASLIPDFERAGIDVELMSNRDLTRACGSMFDAIQAKSFRHMASEQTALREAVLMARKRELEGAWALARKGGDIAPLVAAVVARYAHADDAPTPVPLMAYR